MERETPPQQEGSEPSQQWANRTNGTGNYGIRNIERREISPNKDTGDSTANEPPQR